MASESSTSRISLRNFVIILLLAPALAFTCLSEHQAVGAVFLVTTLLWFSEAIPLPVTALLVPIWISVFGLLEPAEAFRPFGNEILFLFLGCFLLSRSMAKYGFDRRLAYWLLSRCLPSNSLTSINVVLAGSSFFFSMWISNTAATAIMCVITCGVLDSIEEKIPDRTRFASVSVRLLLSCAFAASIGGLATPIGSPPNTIALQALIASGLPVSFLDWMMIGLPISLLMFGCLLLLLELRHPLRGIEVPDARLQFQREYEALGPLSRGERQVASVFLLAVMLWVLPSAFAQFFPATPFFQLAAERLTMSVVGLGCGLVLFVLPVQEPSGEQVGNLEWRESAQIDWGTILLFGGGLALGNLLDQSGAAKAFGDWAFQSGGITLLMLIPLLVVTAILLSEFASNTAAAAILTPLMVGAAQSMQASDEVLKALLLGVAFSASFGFMLPVSTPPNAIVYGTGRIRARDMIKLGAWFDICGALVIIGWMLLVTKL